MRYLGILGCYMAQRESGSLPTSRLEDRFPGWCPLKISLGLVAVMDRLSNVLPRLLWWQWIALGCGLTHHFQGEWIAPWPARFPICLSGRGAMDCTGWGLPHHSLKDMDCTRLETYPSASESSGLHLPEGQTPVTEHPPTFCFACFYLPYAYIYLVSAGNNYYPLKHYDASTTKLTPLGSHKHYDNVCDFPVRDNCTLRDFGTSVGDPKTLPSRKSSNYT
jgi:hypothetical protein